ncbi:uncharacterized protein LOC130137569 [Syzygium oleosum]|uniref:uncharacterized protein LOC130137569 n=1 Tax=Syzygium oleosum TaxID=219896 RepID=UPI0024BA02E5|nr:uncharacterized protein LOC130137569 [Syzygium oleosum]
MHSAPAVQGSSEAEHEPEPEASQAEDDLLDIDLEPILEEEPEEEEPEEVEPEVEPENESEESEEPVGEPDYVLPYEQSPSLSMPPARHFGVPMHTVHDEIEYPFHCVGLETTGPIRGFERLQHTSEDAVNWEPWDKYTPDGEVTDPDDLPENPEPEPEPVPEPEPEPEPKEEPMVSEHEEELWYPSTRRSRSRSTRTRSQSLQGPIQIGHHKGV